MLVIDNCSQLLKMNYTGSLTRSGMIAETLPELLVVLVAIVLFLVYKSWKRPNNLPAGKLQSSNQCNQLKV